MLLLCSISCRQEKFCTEPRCQSSDVSTRLKATLSGATGKYVKLGDTLQLYMKIPDTLKTNYGNIVVRSVEQARFGIEQGCFDSLTTTGSINTSRCRNIPTYIKGGQSNYNIPNLNNPTRELLALYIPQVKAKYYMKIGVINRMEMTATDGRRWLINFSVDVVVPDRHHDLYVSWTPESQKAEMRQILDDYEKNGLCWYAFQAI